MGDATVAVSYAVFVVLFVVLNIEPGAYIGAHSLVHVTVVDARISGERMSSFSTRQGNH